MISGNTISSVRDLLDQISQEGNLQSKAESVVQRKLGNMLYARGETNEIAKDAMQQVITNLLSALAEGTSKTFSDKNLDGRVVTKSDVEGYLMAGVQNYCNTRAERWSTDKSAPRKNDKDDENQEEKTKGTSGLENIAVRARQPILSKNPYGTDFWDDNVRTEFDSRTYEAERIEKILIGRGLSEEEIDLINDKLSGTSFVDMANEKGGTADKYRKKFKRALDRADLEV